MKLETVEINGIKLPITEKCKGVMGKSLENMTREELIASVHSLYSQLVESQKSEFILLNKINDRLAF